jgi:hypothetical protein
VPRAACQVPHARCRVPRARCRVPRAACRIQRLVSAVPSRGTVGVIAILLLIGMFAGCSSSKEAKDEETFYLAAFEDFDPEEHPDVVPPPPPEITDHDIPDRVLGPGQEQLPRRIRGYRVQLFSSRDKREADAEHQRAIDWWESNRYDENLDQPPIYVEYEQPYYKVRLGDYQSREAAARDADKVARTFRGAFVVPAIVVIGDR